MLSTSFDRRAIGAAAISLFAVAMLAACDTDKAVAPTSGATIPTAAAPIRSLGNTGTLVIKVVDNEDHLLGGTSFKVTGPLASVINVTDNDATDADNTKGVITLTGLQPGLYTGCEVTPSSNYALPLWNCHSSTVYAGATTGMEKFVSNRLPYMQGSFVDNKGAKVGGVTITIQDSVGTPIATVLDNSPADKNPTAGQFSVQLPSAGKFTTCEAALPAGYAPAPGSPSCLTVTVQWELPYMLPAFKLYPAPSATWQIVDGWGAGVGPSTFTYTTGFISNTVVDNGQNDLDQSLGRILVKFPKPAVYTICETQPPPGHWMDPNCHTVDVTNGLAVSAGVFKNPEAQVPSQ